MANWGPIPHGLFAPLNRLSPRCDCEEISEDEGVGVGVGVGVDVDVGVEVGMEVGVGVVGPLSMGVSERSLMASQNSAESPKRGSW